MSELKLHPAVINRRKWNQHLYDVHTTEYMVGQTGLFVDRARAVVDVGAAVGMYSAFWARMGVRHVYSFEAVPIVFKQLQATAKRFDNMTAFNMAVSDFNGQTEFWVDDKRLSNSSFRNLVDGQKITVDVTTLDAFRPRHFPTKKYVGFIKIDVEGCELRVLNGAENLILEDRPVCMVEIYPKFNEGPVEDTFRWFFGRNFSCFYNVRRKGLVPVESVEHGADVAHKKIDEHDGDFLFVPNGRTLTS